MSAVLKSGSPLQPPIAKHDIDAVALVERLKAAMVRPDYAFSPVDAQTTALSVGWVIGDKAIISLAGADVQVIEATHLTCSNDFGWMLLKRANAEQSPLYLARMFGVGGPVERLIETAPKGHLQKCVMINRVIGANIPFELRTNYERDENGMPIIFKTSKEAFQSELSKIYRRLSGAAVIRHCVRVEEGCPLE